MTHGLPSGQVSVEFYVTESMIDLCGSESSFAHNVKRFWKKLV